MEKNETFILIDLIFWPSILKVVLLYKLFNMFFNINLNFKISLLVESIEKSKKKVVCY